jgi:hypothetical protein
MIFHHVRVLSDLMIPPARLYNWRLQNGQEVDLVVEHGRRLLGIEVKMSAQGYGDTAALRQAHPGQGHGLRPPSPPPLY